MPPKVRNVGNQSAIVPRVRCLPRHCRGRHRTMSATASWRHVSLSLSEFPLPVVSSLVPISLGNLSQFESTRVGWRGRGRVDKRSEIGEVHNSFFVCRELHRRRPGQNLHYFPPNTPPPTTSLTAGPHSGECMGAISCIGPPVTRRRNAALCHTAKII